MPVSATFPKQPLRDIVEMLESAPSWDAAPRRPNHITSPLTYGLSPYARVVRNALGAFSPHADVPRKAMIRVRRTLRDEDARLAEYETWLRETLRPTAPEWVHERYARALVLTADLRKVLAEALAPLI